MVGTILMVVLIIGLPYIMLKLEKKVPILKKLGSVFLCYAAGIALSFLLKALGAELTLASDAASVLVCVAMPLILFSANIPALKNLAKPMLISFAINAVVVIGIAAAAYFIFRNTVAEADKLSAMMVGTYTGGTPNMFAIGKGLGASPDLILYAQTSDLIAGGIYFFLLISVMPKLMGRFLPAYRFTGKNVKNESEDYSNTVKRASFKNYLLIILLGIACAAVAMGICLVLPSKYGNTGLAKLGEHTAIIMILVTTFGIALSFVKKVRNCPGSYSAGQYFILMFSAAMGMCFDVSMISSQAIMVLVVLLVIQFGTVIIHMLLAKLFKIDSHSAIMTSTAGVFGPAFVIPVAKALKNDEIILPGILCGILGYAIGNYLGIGLGMLFALCG